MMDLTPHRSSLAAFAERWQIREVALFGSALREDFGPESDADLLATFSPGETWSLLDLARMQIELEDMVGRAVDLVEVRALRNPVRRRLILDSSETVYAAA